MKKNVMKVNILCAILLVLVSCKNEKKELADKRIKELEMYVDSLKTVNTLEREKNWQLLSGEYDRKSDYADEAVLELNEAEREKSQEQLENSKTRYNEIKKSVYTEIEKNKVVAKPSMKQMLRNRFFGSGKIGEDMNFSWVTKDNILKTYENFFSTYKNNKSNFSREDYDEVKLMYEALDSRKNTVEKEGLTTADNTSIGAIKLKFATMFKINRIGAKARENDASKE